MLNYLKFYFIILMVFTTTMFAQLPTAVEIAADMKIGWNIGNSLEVPSSETDWGNPKINQVLIDAVKAAGFNTVRIPCSWYSHSDSTTHIIDSTYITRVAEVVDYCYANNMYVILNCHWDGGWLENNVTTAKRDTVNKLQYIYWTQIAEYFNKYDEHLLFASANEPNVDTYTQMAVLTTYHQTFIDAVRATGGNNKTRTLVLQGPSTDIAKTFSMMNTLPVDSISSRLIVEVHYYTPYNFCLMTEDADWGKMVYFWGKNYHSTTNAERNATKDEESIVEFNFEKMKTKFIDKGIPVIIGEYLAIKRTALTEPDLSLHIASRNYFLKYVTESALRHGIIPFYWDAGNNGNNGSALFNRNTGEIVDQSAIDSIMAGAANVTTSVEGETRTETRSTIEYVKAVAQGSSSAALLLYLTKTENADVAIYNILGQRVAHFNNRYFYKGLNKMIISTGNLAAGTYIIGVKTGNKMLTNKFMILH